MKKVLFIVFAFIICFFKTNAQEIDSSKVMIEAIEKSLNFKFGTIILNESNSKINIPEGFKYLDKDQSIYVLTDLWGNPPDSSILGMIVPSEKGVLSENGWAFVITYSEMGYVKDDDADDIDYDELLKQMQKETEDNNSVRKVQGYEPITLIGWASDPFYDKNNKTLHWAEEMKFGGTETNTLNYNLRILGRKGVLNLNAVSTMSELPEVKANIDKIIKSVEFMDGNKYSDYIPDVDTVAAWTIGGLVAGKVLAKAGFFAVLLKFGKVIFLAVIGFFGVIWRFLSGKKDDDSDEK